MNRLLVWPERKFAVCAIDMVVAKQINILMNLLNFGDGGNDSAGGAADFMLRSNAERRGIGESDLASGWSFAVVYRDPAERFLAAWLANCASSEKDKDNCLGDFAVANFAESVRGWLGAYGERLRSAGTLNANYDPQRLFCGGRPLGEYDFVGYLTPKPKQNNNQFRYLFQQIAKVPADRANFWARIDELFPLKDPKTSQAKLIQQGALSDFFKDVSVYSAVRSALKQDYDMLDVQPGYFKLYEGPGEAPTGRPCFHAAFEQQPRKRLGGDLWQQAVAEAGLDPATISEFGRLVPKLPRSMVMALLGLRANRSRMYHFAGSCSTSLMCGRVLANKIRRRQWVRDFAEVRMREGDYYRVTDADATSYVTLGPFDKSLEAYRGDASKPYDERYFATLAESRFTLCPGGDSPWSMRVYEAALMGSIPLINSRGDDWAPQRSYQVLVGNALKLLFRRYKHVTVENHLSVGYREDWAEQNLRTFIKYQTFIEGDNVP